MAIPDYQTSPPAGTGWTCRAGLAGPRRHLNEQLAPTVRHIAGQGLDHRLQGRDRDPLRPVKPPARPEYVAGTIAQMVVEGVLRLPGEGDAVHEEQDAGDDARLEQPLDERRCRASRSTGGSSIASTRSRAPRRVGHIFVVRTDDGLVVKRAGKDRAGAWQLISNNPNKQACRPYPGPTKRARDRPGQVGRTDVCVRRNSMTPTVDAILYRPTPPPAAPTAQAPRPPANANRLPTAAETRGTHDFRPPARPPRSTADVPHASTSHAVPPRILPRRRRRPLPFRLAAATRQPHPLSPPPTSAARPPRRIP